MRLFASALCASLVLGGLAVETAGGQGRGRAGDRGTQQDLDRGNRHDGVDVGVRVVFSTRDADVLRTHYAPRYRNLPPGLRKKLARTGQLPPGWQKKMEPFPVDVERRLVALPTGYQRGVFEGHAVIYNPRTSVIIDATVLF